MAHILVASSPFAGHVRPTLAVAEALLLRGHRVTAYTGRRYARDFEALGCRILPWQSATDYDERNLAASFPQLPSTGRRAVFANLEHVFIGNAPGQLDDLRRAHAASPFDILVSEQMMLGAGMLAELQSLPWASLSVLPLSLPSRNLPPSGLGLQPLPGALGHARDALLRRVTRRVMRPLDAALAEVRKQAGLPERQLFEQAGFSTQLTIAHGAPGIDFPRPDLPGYVHYAGLLARPIVYAGPEPDWLREVRSFKGPVVLVAQGTLNTDPQELLQPALDALRDEDLLVVASSAGRSVQRIPPNARVHEFLPFGDLLPLASCAVTNGGWGGVLQMAAAGVPMVVAGGTLDKPEVAARVACAGLGLDLRTGTPTPRKILRVVRSILAEPGFRTRTAAVGDQLHRLGGAPRAAGLIESLAPGASPRVP